MVGLERGFVGGTGRLRDRFSVCGKQKPAAEKAGEEGRVLVDGTKS